MAAVRTIRRAQWFLMSLPMTLLGWSGDLKSYAAVLLPTMLPRCSSMFHDLSQRWMRKSFAASKQGSRVVVR